MTERRAEPVIGASLVLWHSNLDHVVAAVRSLAAQDVPIALVAIVVNDDPDAEVARNVEQRLGQVLDQDKLVVRPVPHNSGFAGGHDLALDELFNAECDYVLVLNPDVVLETECVSRLVAQAQQRTDPILVGPLLQLATKDLVAEGSIDTVGIRWTASGRHLDALQGSPVTRAPGAPTRVAGISGACMLVSRAAYERVVALSGEFFDSDFIAYREDAELGFRASLLGVESWVEPRAIALHIRSVRGTSRNTSPWVNALGVRNRFLIAAKFGRRRPGTWPLPWLRDMVVVLAVLVVERGSLPALGEAWRLRHRMRAKGRQVLRAHAEIPR